MYPALSVIFFTTLSGAGYGLWFLLGLACLCGSAPDADVSLRVLLVGFVLVSIGLFASIGHLGKPLRAWRAFSQWRSSWLSREGIAAVLTYLPAFTLGAVFSSLSHFPYRVLGALLVLGATATVFCTARIYSSLPTIRAWCNVYVLPGYLLFALYSGSLWFWVLKPAPEPTLPCALAALATVGIALKLSYWRFVDRADCAPTRESATGLGAFGRVRTFERPHTEESYLTREMGFVVARRHARTLRRSVLALGFGLPALLALACLAWPSARLAFALPALVSGSLGLLIERWLFFAEARHTVALYYDAHAT